MDINKNEKKKKVIRFGAIAVAIMIFGGVFSAWAFSTQAPATAGIGEILVDGLTVEPGANASEDETLLEDSWAGSAGTVNANDTDPYELYDIGEGEEDALDEATYTSTVYLMNGADLMDAGIRYLTLDMNLTDHEGETIDNHTLTLENGRVQFTFTAEDLGGSGNIDGSVNITGGSYGTHTFASFDTIESVEFLIDIEPGVDL